MPDKFVQKLGILLFLYIFNISLRAFHVSCMDSIHICPIFAFFILKNNRRPESLLHLLLGLNTLVHRWSSFSESHTDAVDHSSAADSNSQVARQLKPILTAELEERSNSRWKHAVITL